MAPIMLHRAAPHILQIDEKFAEPDCRSNLEFPQAQDAFLIMQTGLHPISHHANRIGSKIGMTGSIAAARC
jgi:hypothetical protein